ncbi:MAG TPA: Rap1a/Tai family immunity protein [Candidatus Acidoferrales bacterium]|nr:Rap1a/Tai family immunity protein [Candidatus Acidoferrales bacterium]
MKMTLRAAFYVFVVVCIVGVVAYAQKQQSKPRVHRLPVYYLTAGNFNGLSDDDQMMYITGLMDGFFGLGLFGANDETVAGLTTCTLGMDVKQATATIVKWVKDHPEYRQYPMSVVAYDALLNACPGVMKMP